LVSAESISLTAHSDSKAIYAKRLKLSGKHGMAALKYFLLVPVFPFLGYWLLDQTGCSAWLVSSGFVPQAILGEGFGHVGLCFSIHYLFSGLHAIWKALSLMLR
jgi:hypothetical protein